EKLVPLGGMALELFQGRLNLPPVALGMLTDELPPAARRCRGEPAQGIEFVVTHDAAGSARLDHVPHQQQRLADARPTVDDIAEKQRLTARVTPDTTEARIAHLLQQNLKRTGTTMHITNDVKALPLLDVCHMRHCVRRLLQPS